MSTTNRFSFPSFTKIREADTEYFEVDIGKINVGDDVFIVHMIRRIGLSFGGEFLLAKVYDQSGEKLLWEFRRQDFEGIGLLAKAGEELVVALVGKGPEGKVKQVILFSSLASHTQVDLRRRIALKRQAAEFLGRTAELSDTERLIARRDAERRAEEERLAKEKVREERQRAREELLKRILARGKVEVFTRTGGKRFGYPVLESEWPSLSNHQFVVLVESYDEVARKPGEPIEAFQVKKEKGRNPSKGNSVPVTFKKPEVEEVSQIPKPVEMLVIETEEGDVYEVALYATYEDVREARTMGLNSGALVTAEDKKTANGRFEVFAVRGEGVETLGLFSPIG